MDEGEKNTCVSTKEKVRMRVINTCASAGGELVEAGVANADLLLDVEAGNHRGLCVMSE